MSMIAPEIQRMIDRPGLYATYMPGQEGIVFVPVFSQNGELWSMRLDSKLDPTGFHQGVMVQGPCTSTQKPAG